MLSLQWCLGLPNSFFLSNLLTTMEFNLSGYWSLWSFSLCSLLNSPVIPFRPVCLTQNRIIKHKFMLIYQDRTQTFTTIKYTFHNCEINVISTHLITFRTSIVYEWTFLSCLLDCISDFRNADVCGYWEFDYIVCLITTLIVLWLTM